MTVTINGTTGIAGTNGSAGTPAVQGEDTNTGIFFPAADTVAVATAGTERLRVDSSGNAGLGVTPAAWASAWKVVQNQGGFLGANGSSVQLVGSNSYSDGTNWRYVNTGLAANYSQVNGVHSWSNAPSGTAGNAITFTQSMTLDANGSFLLGVTSAQNGNNSDLPGITLYGSTGDAKGAATFVRQSPSSVMVVNNRTAGGGLLVFLNGGNVVGTITSNGSSTFYNTGSDYRLKEDWQPMTGASERVLSLKPVNFAWKVNGSRVDGFLAHEAQEVVPEAVTGAKDEVDDEGNPKYQGIDQSKLVPLLTAALQEALAEIANLKTRVAQLEAQ